MDTIAYVVHGGVLPGASVQVDGDLSLRQTSPLSVYGGELWSGSFSRPCAVCIGRYGNTV